MSRARRASETESPTLFRGVRDEKPRPAVLYTRTRIDERGSVEAHGEKSAFSIEDDAQVAARARVALLADRPRERPGMPVWEGPLGLRDHANGDTPSRGPRTFRESRSSALGFWHVDLPQRATH